MTDIQTTWTKNRATWNKGSHGVLQQISDIEDKLPFTINGFDCDNGSEFLNYHLVRYFTDRPQPAYFTRSRPYRKNDNARVEQKNWSHVRQIFGYDRLADPHIWIIFQTITMPQNQLTFDILWEHTFLVPNNDSQT